MTAAPSAFVVLALFLTVAGSSLSVGVTAISALPRFRQVAPPARLAGEFQPCGRDRARQFSPVRP